MTRRPDIVVTVATYKRPALLLELLESLKAQEGLGDLTFSTIVVDNDPDRSALETTSRADLGVDYIHEPQPGIVAARNAGLEAARVLEPRAVAFIDDDEVAGPYWLASLMRTLEEYGADVVTGPVEYVMPVNRDHLKAEVSYFQTPDIGDGTVISDVKSGNTLVRAEWFYGPHSLRFDESYSMTGGSDLELFHRLQSLGGTCFWSSAAVTYEAVSNDRASHRWVRQRDLRNGQLRARLLMDVEGRSRVGVLTAGLLRVIKGVTLVGLDIISRRGPVISHWRTLKTGLGYLRAVRGSFYEEYAQGR